MCFQTKVSRVQITMNERKTKFRGSTQISMKIKTKDFCLKKNKSHTVVARGNPRYCFCFGCESFVFAKKKFRDTEKMRTKKKMPKQHSHRRGNSKKFQVKKWLMYEVEGGEGWSSSSKSPEGSSKQQQQASEGEREEGGDAVLMIWLTTTAVKGKNRNKTSCFGGLWK